jgi:hypothetical protein
MMRINPIRFAIVNQDEKSNLSNLQQKTRATLMKIKKNIIVELFMLLY